MTIGYAALHPDPSGVATPGVDRSTVGVTPAVTLADFEVIQGVTVMVTAPFLRILGAFSWVQMAGPTHQGSGSQRDALLLAAAAQQEDLHLDAALRQVEELRRLGTDWDSYGAAAPSAQAIETARAFLKTIARSLEGVFGEHVRPFAVAPVPDGGVHIEWRTPTGNGLEVEVGPDGSFGYLLIEQQAGGRVFREDEGVPPDQVLRHLVNILLPTLEGRNRAITRPR